MDFQEYPKAIGAFLARDAGEEAAIVEAMKPAPEPEPPVDDLADAAPKRRKAKE